jgi:transcriptional regulator with XRE-family HTH domain
MTMDQTAILLLGPKELAEYGAERIRNEAFDQVRLLWQRRKAEGWTQKRLADAIGRDPSWISRTLSAPGNWTIRTIGAFTQGLDGEATVTIFPLEDDIYPPSNYDAYDGYRPRTDDLIPLRPILIDITKQENWKPIQFGIGVIDE